MGQILSSVGLVYGCMKSGKSAYLLKHADLLQLEGAVYVALKPILDVRDGAYISSRESGSEPLLAMMVPTDLGTYLDSEVISEFSRERNLTFLVDEVFMFDGGSVMDFMSQQRDLGNSIVFSGLDLNFRGEAFQFQNSTLTMLDLAKEVDWSEQVYARCDVCASDKAEYTQRLLSDGGIAPYDDPELVVGDRLYQARCSECFVVPS